MSKPIRIQLSRRKGWKMPPNTVVVARGPGRKFGNPYKVGCRYMLATGEVKTITAKIAAKMFEVWAKVPTGSGKRPYVDMVKRELRGKNLACWCSLNGPCHADTLLEVANVLSVSPAGHEGRQAVVNQGDQQ